MNALRKLLTRRHFVVDRRFQASVVWRTTLFSTFLVVVLLVGVLAPIVHDLRSPNSDAITITDTAIVLLYVHDRLWWMVGAFLVLSILHSLHISHRIAGPLVRVKRNLRMLGQGRLPSPLRTRDNDYLKDEVDVLNEAVRNLGQRIDAIRAAHATMSDALSRARGHFLTHPDPDVRRSAIEALAAAEQMKVHLGAIRHEADPDPSLQSEKPIPAKVEAALG
jgi:hypothetical protein